MSKHERETREFRESMSDNVQNGKRDGKFGTFYKKKIRTWLAKEYFKAVEIDPTKKELLLVDTPDLACTRFLHQVGIKTEYLKVVCWDRVDITIPAALAGITFIGRSVYSLSQNDVRNVALAFVDVCNAGVARYKKEFKDKIDAFALVPKLVETHSWYGSFFMTRPELANEMYIERHQHGVRKGKCTQVQPYPGLKNGKMYLIHSHLEGFSMESCYFGAPTTSKVGPVSPGLAGSVGSVGSARSVGSVRPDTDGPPSKRLRSAF